jgi:hypothetical protein
MAKTDLTLTEKIARLEQQKQQFLARRKYEIFDIFNRYSAITIDDNLLAGFLIFVNNQGKICDVLDGKAGEVSDISTLKELRELAIQNKTPSRSRQTSVQTAKSNSESIEANC